MINSSIFREYDIRGIAETDLSHANVSLLGKGIGTYMKRKGLKNVIVGRDVRLSSPRIRQELIKSLTSTGLNVTDIGEVPTPVFYFGIVHLKMDGGTMITGSHNPIEFNGFKLNNGLNSIFGQEIQVIRQIIEKGDFEKGVGKEASAEIVPAYLDMLKSKLKFNKKLKIVIDAGNGTASIIAPKFFEEMGLEVVRLYCEPDGRFPNHLPDPTVPKYMVDLTKKVLEVKADAGIGYDGDSDRIGAIDNKGRQIFADRLLALFSKNVLARNPGGQIVFDVKCSQALPEYILKHGGQPVMYKTGHSLLKAKMKEIHSPLAGEMSGHMFFADDFFGFDDAIYASGRLLQMIANTDKTLAEYADEIPPFVSTPEIRVETTDEAKFKIVDELVKYFKSKYEVNDIDGARVLFGNGWGLVRASNTQPVLVLRFEARTEKQLEAIKTIFRNKLKEFPGIFLKAEDF
jgi:phosphomannomutase/phosphoglucomutase